MSFKPCWIIEGTTSTHTFKCSMHWQWSIFSVSWKDRITSKKTCRAQHSSIPAARIGLYLKQIRAYATELLPENDFHIFAFLTLNFDLSTLIKVQVMMEDPWPWTDSAQKQYPHTHCNWVVLGTREDPDGQGQTGQVESRRTCSRWDSSPRWVPSIASPCSWWDSLGRSRSSSCWQTRMVLECGQLHLLVCGL